MSNRWATKSDIHKPSKSRNVKQLPAALSADVGRCSDSQGICVDDSNCIGD
jgi:hypothetical protein